EVDPFGTAGSTVVGASAASCLGAAALTQMSLGRTVGPRMISLWELAQGDVSRGPGESVVPLDLGSVAVVGAGAVASALAYWTSYIGVVGDWVFVDGDIVALHNTNRSVGLFARHAGWVDGEPGGDVSTKAIVTGELVGARHYPGWYEDWLVDEPSHADLV